MTSAVLDAPAKTARRGRGDSFTNTPWGKATTMVDQLIGSALTPRHFFHIALHWNRVP
jgi:hypothetical protein